MTLSVHFVLEDPKSNYQALSAFILGYITAQLQTLIMVASNRSSVNPLLNAVLDGLQLPFHFEPPQASFIHRIIADVGLVGLQVTALIVNPLPQVIVLGAMDLSIREKTTQGADIFHLKGNSTSGLGGQELQPGTSELHLSLSTMDANLKDLFLVGRLIGDAADGAVVVGVSGPLTITIRPNFTVTLDYMANGVTAELSCLVVCGSAHSILNPATWFPEPKRLGRDSTTRELWAETSSDALHVTRDDFIAAGGSSLVARYPEDVQLEALWQVALTRDGQVPMSGEGHGSLCSVSRAPAKVRETGMKEVTVGATDVRPFFSTMEVAEVGSVLSVWTAAGAQHQMRIVQLDHEEMMVLGEEGALLVLFGISGVCSAYFPLQKLGQKLCLCPDCRADGGGDGFKLREGEVLLMSPAEGIAVVAIDGGAQLVAISIWTRASVRGARL
eukprot:symbB.v1.2.036612.t1/scaffold5194.1/size29914/2